MSRNRLLALVGVVAIVVAACGGTQASPAATGSAPVTSGVPSVEPSGALAAEQILRVDLGQEPPTLDPNKAQDATSLAVLRALHRPLVYIDQDLNVVDALAESHTVSDDAKTLTFTLRDAMYSNGDPIVAEDLVFSWKRLVDPRTAAPYAYVMCDVAGAAAIMGAEGGCAGGPAQPTTDAAIDDAIANLGVAAPDPKTFVVTLATPATYFLSAMTLWIGVPTQEKWINSANFTEAANYVSSGPFLLDTWSHNSQIILKPNPNWYGDVKPTLTEITMAMSPEPAQTMALYETDEIDMLLPVASEDIARVKGDPVLGLEYSEGTDLSVTYYNYNNGVGVDRCTSPRVCPTMNKNFRIALTQAIDKQAFQDTTFAGIGRLAGTFVQPGIPGAIPDYEPYPFDLTKAKASMDTALQEIGFASAAEVPELKIGYNSEAGHEPRVAFLTEAWTQAFGLQFDQIGSDFALFLTQRTDGMYDIARNGWGADYPHANNQLNGLFTCGGGNNDQQWCNEAFDDLLGQAAVEGDQAAQQTLYEQAGTLLADEAASLFLRWGVQAQLRKPYVSGVTDTPMDSSVPGEHFYETIQILEH